MGTNQRDQDGDTFSLSLDDDHQLKVSEQDYNILIVDDDTLIRNIISDSLVSLGHRTFEAECGKQALDMAMETQYDLILCDIMMPEMSGLKFLELLRNNGCDAEVIMVTASQDLNSAITAMRYGASDFITKPFKIENLKNSVEEALQRVDLKGFTRDYTQSLERKVEAQDDLMRILFYEAIQTMINAIEAKDDYTKGHSQRVTKYAMWLVKKLGLDFEEARDVHLASQLHDIGKLSVPDAILNKPGPLTEDEFSIIKMHPERGCRVLAPILSDDNLKTIMHHHEKWAGDGYPMGLSGSEIPLGSRITTIADSFDAITSKRSYRDPMKVPDALEEIRRGSGVHYDPELTEPFTAAVKANAKIC